MDTDDLDRGLIERRKTRLKRAMRARGLTQLAVASAIGWNHTTFSNLVTGKIRRLDDADATAIARVLGLTPHILFFGSDEEFDATLQQTSDPHADPDVDHIGRARAASDARGGELRRYRVESWVDANLEASGPAAMPSVQAFAQRKRVFQDGHSRRGRDEPVRVVELSGLPHETMLLEYRGPELYEVREDGRQVDIVRPRELLVVDPNAEPRDGSYVLAFRDIDEDADPDVEPELAESVTKLMRYRRPIGIPMFYPLNGNPDEAQLASRGWSCIGVVVQRITLDGSEIVEEDRSESDST